MKKRDIEDVLCEVHRPTILYGKKFSLTNIVGLYITEKLKHLIVEKVISAAPYQYIFRTCYFSKQTYLQISV